MDFNFRKYKIKEGNRNIFLNVTIDCTKNTVYKIFFFMFSHRLFYIKIQLNLLQYVIFVFHLLDHSHLLRLSCGEPPPPAVGFLTKSATKLRSRYLQNVRVDFIA